MQRDSSNNNGRGKERKILQREGGGSRSGNSRRGDERGHDAADAKANSRTVVIEGIKIGTTVVGRVHENESYGFVVSLKQAFGFIQSIFSEEQIYFSEREYYHNIKTTDLVGFIPTQGTKGPAAQNVRALIPQISKILTNIQGSIVRSNERHRSGCGLVDIGNNVAGLDPEIKTLLKNRYNNQIPFRTHDIVTSSLPRNHYLDRGDVISFTLSRMHDSNLFLATEVTLKQLKREKSMSDQIQRMLDAGVTREVGVISTVKNKEYGFIRAQDRKDEIFFRIDDVTETGGKEIVEGVELEFFVIAEMIRGRLCDRATYLKVIPRGTVQYEVNVASNISVVVTKEPKEEESPGTGKLQHAIDVSELIKAPNGETSIKEIDLWQRCLPDDLLIRKGDTLIIDVHFYRPEKIFFARSVRVGQYLSLGRETGVVCTLRDNNIFGFITSDTREIDLYFRGNCLVDPKGKVLPAGDVKKGMKVAFDVIVEDGKFRAVRVQQIADNHGANKDDSSRYVLKKNIPGAILRNAMANKKGAIGYVELSPSKWKEINDLVFLDPQLVASIANFMNNDVLQEIEIHGLPVSIRRAYYDILDKLFPTLRHESVPIPGMEKIANLDNAVFKTLKIWKAGKSANQSNPENTQDMHGLTKDGKPKGGYVLPFGKEDMAMNDSLVGPLPGNVDVIFDVWWDKTKGRKVAKNIRLTDEAIPDMTGEYVGIVDVLFEKGTRHGILRMIPTDESIMFSAGSVPPPPAPTAAVVVTATPPTAVPATDGEESSPTVASTPVPAVTTPSPEPTLKDLKVGAEVTFNLRKRGGYRYATNVRPVDPTQRPEVSSQLLPDLCLALVIDPKLAILIDANNVTELKEKYLDLASLDRLLSAVNDQHNVVSSKSARSLSLRSEEGSAPVAATTGTDAQGTGLEEVDVVVDTPTVTASAVKSIPTNASYFPPLLRQAIALKPSDSSSTPVEYKVGDIVACQCEVQFVQSRTPLALIVQEVVTTAKASKGVGKISQVKFRIKPDVVHLPAVESLLNPRYNYTTFDFTEVVITEPETEIASSTTSSSATPAAVPATAKKMYSLFQEFIIPDYYREGLKAGVEVEFWTVPSLSSLIVFGLTIVPSKDALLFSRAGPGINDKLKEMKVKAGTVMNLITMAEGPPNETAKGFKEGWRVVDKEKVAQLPWATALLTHLQNPN